MDILHVPPKLPDRIFAESLASAFVEERFASCVNILQPCHSVFRRQDGIEKADKILKFSALQIISALPDYFTCAIAEAQAVNWFSS